MRIIRKKQKLLYLNMLTDKNGLFYINFSKLLSLDSSSISMQSPQWGTSTTTFKSGDSNIVLSLYSFLNALFFLYIPI